MNFFNRFVVGDSKNSILESHQKKGNPSGFIPPKVQCDKTSLIMYPGIFLTKPTTQIKMITMTKTNYFTQFENYHKFADHFHNLKPQITETINNLISKDTIFSKKIAS